jgi:hypothetical protein
MRYLHAGGEGVLMHKNDGEGTDVHAAGACGCGRGN